MANLRTLLFGSAALTGALLSAGCSSSDPQMSASEAADFNGKNAKPMTDVQRKAMNDFKDNFNKAHPPTGGPGVPPPGMK